MTDNITLPRAVGEQVRLFMACYDKFLNTDDVLALAALDAALAEPEQIHTCGPDCQKPLCANRRREIAAAVEAEREAICKIVYGLCVSDNNAQEIVNAIRARGAQMSDAINPDCYKQGDKDCIDAINPNHYKQGDKEGIDALRAALWNGIRARGSK